MSAHTVGSPQERRARLGRRHALAVEHRALDAVGAARAVVALHGTDPATTVLSAALRTTDPSIDAAAAALHEDRTLVRVLAMRRTVFAVVPEHAGDLLVACGTKVAREQRRLLVQMLTEAEVTDDAEAWIDHAEDLALTVLGRGDELTAAELAESDPVLGTRIALAVGTKYETTVSAASRLLTMLSAQGRVVRAHPRGTWASTQFRWSEASRWTSALEHLPEDAAAGTAVAERWLRAFGPALPEDLQWWTGWTKTRTRQALATLDLEEVELHGASGIVLADDTEPAPDPEPWVALLPALDPTTMGWKHRDFYLGDHRAALFDTNGNAGRTVWVEGRIVGGWAQRDDGEVVTELLDDVGAHARDEIDARAHTLQELLGDVRLKARSRGWTVVEKRLRS